MIYYAAEISFPSCICWFSAFRRLLFRFHAFFFFVILVSWYFASFDYFFLLVSIVLFGDIFLSFTLNIAAFSLSHFLFFAYISQPPSSLSFMAMLIISCPLLHFFLFHMILLWYQSFISDISVIWASLMIFFFRFYFRLLVDIIAFLDYFYIFRSMIFAFSFITLLSCQLAIFQMLLPATLMPAFDIISILRPPMLRFRFSIYLFHAFGVLICPLRFFDYFTSALIISFFISPHFIFSAFCRYFADFSSLMSSLSFWFSLYYDDYYFLRLQIFFIRPSSLLYISALIYRYLSSRLCLHFAIRHDCRFEMAPSSFAFTIICYFFPYAYYFIYMLSRCHT